MHTNLADLLSGLNAYTARFEGNDKLSAGALLVRCLLLTATACAHAGASGLAGALRQRVRRPRARHEPPLGG